MYQDNYGQNSNNGFYGSPDNPMGTNSSMARGSFICGFISLGLGITAIFSVFAIPVGAVGCIMGMLSSRMGKKTPKKAMTGIIASAVGCVIGLVITASLLITTLSQYPLSSIIQQYNDMYEQIENGNYSLGSYSDFGSYNSIQDYLNGSGTIER